MEDFNNMTHFTPAQINEFANIGAFLADPAGEVSQVNTVVATINFLTAHPDRVAEKLTSEEEDALFRDVLDWAGIDSDGVHIDEDDPEVARCHDHGLNGEADCETCQALFSEG